MMTQTDTLRQAALQGDPSAQSRYQMQIQQNADQLNRCRSQSWLKIQAVWLRVYPCDAKPGQLDELFDRIVSRGYNEVFLETFGDGQVLLPSADNRTAWPSILRVAGYENRDLLAEAIAKGRERGIKVYAWMFTLNFGYPYSLRSGADAVLARNGRGETSQSFIADKDAVEGGEGTDETFVDPYNPQAQRDYSTLLLEVLKRHPDGGLFDYVRYPRGTGGATIADDIRDLWIYGSASREALLNRAQNQKGRELISRFIDQGALRANDITEVNALYPQEAQPLWQGRNPADPKARFSPDQLSALQTELWLLGVAHAMQGVVDFLTMAVTPVQQQGVSAAAVFFPEGNRMIRQWSFDSRLQPWDRFPSTIEWHPMSYAICDNRPDCVVAEVDRVLEKAQPNTPIEPAIAGTWGQPLNRHPALEAQMQAIHQAAPQINAISHFALSWQDVAYDRSRKTCQL
jgi:hypothetical protein